MKEIIALQEYTDKYISLYEGEIRNIQDGIADKLIEKGVVAEHDQTSPSSGSNLKYIKDDPSDNGGVIEGLINGETGHVNVASGENAHAEGGNCFEEEDEINIASGRSSHAEGAGTTASGDFSHAEGWGTKTSGECSHAEGQSCIASGECSHAEGIFTKASGECSHAEGNDTTASAFSSHAEGDETTASGDFSHAEGNNTTASGNFSHAEGNNTIANHRGQHVIGEFNIVDPSTAIADQRGNYVCIIGNGTANNSRSNALAIKWDGTLVLSDGTEVTQAQIKALLEQSVIQVEFAQNDNNYSIKRVNNDSFETFTQQELYQKIYNAISANKRIKANGRENNSFVDYSSEIIPANNGIMLSTTWGTNEGIYMREYSISSTGNIGYGQHYINA